MPFTAWKHEERNRQKTQMHLQKPPGVVVRDISFIDSKKHSLEST